MKFLPFVFSKLLYTSVSSMASNSSDQILRFNVGGKIFETTATTLAAAGSGSFFAPLLNGKQPNDQDAIFIDRNPKCFSVILDLLRTGELHIPPNVPKDLLLKEAQFYGVLDHVRAATWGPIDGNRLSLSTSAKIATDQTPNAIRASPTGGCCVASARTIRVYDWMLREQSPIILDYEFVDDIAWMDSKNIIVTAPKSIRLFNSSTGEQTLEFYLTDQTLGFKPDYSFCALCIDNDGKIYSGCYGKGIGVWAPHRSEPIDFINNNCHLAKVDKLQWLPETRCLLVGSYNPSFANYCVTLLDLRQKKWVIYRPGSDAGRNRVHVEDMVGMESKNRIVTVDEDEKLGFIDLRFNYSSDFQLYRSRKEGNQKVKLIEHNGQLFSSKSDHISVYSSSGHKLSLMTSRLGTLINTLWIDEITDLSIANDRLFSLRSLSDIGGASLDVWETSPCSPILY